MKKNQNFKLLIPVLIVALFIISSCDKNNINSCNSCGKHYKRNMKDFEVPEHSISFITGNNYFVRNDVESKIVQTFKIETQEQFDSIFGPASYMGDEGIPTVINFKTQFVIAVIDTLSTKNVCMQAMYLLYEGNDLVLHYQKTIGKKLTYTMRNRIISIVDKQFTGEVKSVVHL